MDWQGQMNRAVGYIEDNLAGEIDLSAAARLAGSSLWEFQRLFSFVAHITLGEYIRGRRLSLACHDLQSGREKIIDIAIKYGYDSPAAFSRAFARQFGVSPSSARGKGMMLPAYPRITFLNQKKEGTGTMEKKNDLLSYSERGYYVQENAPVYYTTDMKKTCAWFCDVLGWYGDIVGFNDDGSPGYGCVFDFPALIIEQQTHFKGIHLFAGEASKGVVGFIKVNNIEKFRQYVLDHGWKQITEIAPQPWGANECAVTTIDGSVIRFFETTD